MGRPRDLAEYQQDLSCVICALGHAYHALTANVPPDDKSLFWENFCERVDRRLLVPLFEILQANRADPGEVCLVALKLLQFAAYQAKLAENHPGEPFQ